MKKIPSLFWATLPHITLILSLMLLTFFVIDLVNESMAFLDNAMTKSLLAVQAAFTVLLSVRCAVKTAKSQKNEKFKGEQK